LRWQGINNKKMKMSTQVDLFTNVEPTSVSPAIAKPFVSRSTFYQGDCLVEMDKIADKSVDLILCDLPYGTTACAWDIIIPFEPLWKQYKRIIKDKGVIVLFGSEPFSSLLRTSNLSWYKYDWIWEKNNAGNFQLVNYQPLKIHETISVFYNETPDMEFANIMLENMKRLELKNIDVSRLELSRTGGMTGWVTNKLNGSLPNNTITPLSFIILLYSFQSLSNGIITSQAQAVVP